MPTTLECVVEQGPYTQKIKARVLAEEFPEGIPGLKLTGLFRFDPWPIIGAPKYLEIQGLTDSSGALQLEFPKAYFAYPPAPTASIEATFSWAGDQVFENSEGKCTITLPPAAVSPSYPVIQLRSLDPHTGQPREGIYAQYGDLLEVVLSVYRVERIDRLKFLLYVGSENSEVIEVLEVELNWQFPGYCDDEQIDPNADPQACLRETTFQKRTGRATGS